MMTQLTHEERKKKGISFIGSGGESPGDGSETLEFLELMRLTRLDPLRGWKLSKQGKKEFWEPNPRPGPDGPNASGWYGRLCGPISPLSVIHHGNYDKNLSCVALS